MSESNIGQIAALIKAVKDMGGYESTREQLAAAIGEEDPCNVIVTGNVQSDWLLELTFRIKALEQRIEKLEADMAVHHAITMNHSDSIDAQERRIEDIEWLTTIVKTHSKLFDAILRKLNHKGGSE